MNNAQLSFAVFAVAYPLCGCERSADATPQPAYEIADVYKDLRRHVLGLTPSKIGLWKAPPSAVVAVLMETGYPDAVVTLVAVADGSASLYFSHGGGVIGTGQHKEVASLVRSFVGTAAEHLKGTAPTREFPLPEMGRVRFYWVTGEGVYTEDGLEDDLGYNRHPCSRLFHHGHAVIAALRERSEGKRR